MRKKVKKITKPKTRLDSIISWVGTPASLVAHTIFFALMPTLRLFGVSASDVMLILTTVVSLEAIYLNIFIQMGVNRQADEQEKTRTEITSLHETVEEVQETMEEVQETMEDVQETIDDDEKDKF